MAQSRRGCFCSVPGCSCGARRQPYLSYHAFPTNPDQRRQWIQAVRRDEGPKFRIKPGNTFVCSRHFTQEDFVSGSAISRLKSGTVPSLFPWNNFIAPPKREPTSEGAQKQQLVHSQQDSLAEVAAADHDYAAHPATGSKSGRKIMSDSGTSVGVSNAAKNEDDHNHVPKPFFPMRHPSIIIDGASLGRTFRSLSEFGCPLCPRVKTEKEKVIQGHLENHIANAVHFQDVTMCRCKRRCRYGSHFHCPYCANTVTRKTDVIVHVVRCAQRCNVELPSVTCNPSTLLPPQSETSPTPSALLKDVTPSVTVDHSYTFSPTVTRLVEDHLDKFSPKVLDFIPLESRPSPPVITLEPQKTSSSSQGKIPAAAHAWKLPPSHVNCPQVPIVLRQKKLVLTTPRKRDVLLLVNEEASWTPSQNIKEEPGEFLISPEALKEEELAVDRHSIICVTVKTEDDDDDDEKPDFSQLLKIKTEPPSSN